MISADPYHQCKIIYILITALLPDAVFTIPLGVNTFGNENSNFVQFFANFQQQMIMKPVRLDSSEALRAFKKIYLEVVHRIIEHLEADEPGNSSR